MTKFIVNNGTDALKTDINSRIGSCLACVYRVMDARGKFGEHERSVRVARGAADSNSSFLSALQTSRPCVHKDFVHDDSIVVEKPSENVHKQSQNTHVEVKIFARQKQRLEAGLGLFRIIFTLPTLN